MLDPPVRALAAVPAAEFARIRQRLLLDSCKWDPQVGDVGTLAEFPLLLAPETWHRLASWAEALTAEALDAEEALLRAPHLYGRLALPPAIAAALGPMPDAPRIMRFDFHWTTDGWQISEVNSDVPGGFTEAASFSTALATHFPATSVAGDPAAAWIQAIAGNRGSAGSIALVAAPGFLEDQQVVAYLARRLTDLGLKAPVVHPGLIQWRDGRASITAPWFRGALDGIVRFYQGEWLSGLNRRTGWAHFFGRSRIPVTNPGRAILSESKRLPLLREALGLAMPTWRALLPETREPAVAPWATSEDWILKSAYSNTGDTVTMRGHTSPDRWARVSREVRARPGAWIAQRRFHSIPLATPRGPLHSCVGIYTVNGRASGICGRLSAGPVVDYRAIDAAVLVGTGDSDERTVERRMEG